MVKEKLKVGDLCVHLCSNELYLVISDNGRFPTCVYVLYSGNSRLIGDTYAQDSNIWELQKVGVVTNLEKLVYRLPLGVCNEIA